MHKKTANILRLILAVFFTAVIVILALLLPSIYAYTEKLSSGGFSFIYNFFFPISALLILPFLLIIIVSFLIPDAIEKDNIFSKKTARILQSLSLLIILDCTLLSVLVILFFALNGPTLAIPFTFLSLIGFVLSAMLIILANYVKRAALIKERLGSKK